MAIEIIVTVILEESESITVDIDSTDEPYLIGAHSRLKPIADCFAAAAQVAVDRIATAAECVASRRDVAAPPDPTSWQWLCDAADQLAAGSRVRVQAREENEG